MSVDPRRMFTRAEVWHAWQRQGCVCNVCRRAIPFDLMHGDHVVAWSLGGPTSMENLQALCGSCNLRKGNSPQEVMAARFGFPADRLRPGSGELRQWQREALPLVLSLVGHEPVLVEACPGAGKTMFGLEVVYRLVEAGRVSRLLVVVPTLGIADGWRWSASIANPNAPSMPLHTSRDWRPVDPIDDDWLGAVVTYQSLFAQTEMFLAHATDPGHRTLVIFDEVHHAGSDAAWGISAQEAFATGAAGVLSLSGTPFRIGKDPIIFAPSKGGHARPHYRYSYDRAIADGACRPVQFVQTRGETTFRAEDGVVHTVTFDDEPLTDLGQRRRLRAALEWIGTGSIAEKMLRDANRYILGLRDRGDVDAAGLVVCIDCDHADRVAAHMKAHVIGFRPVVACSRRRDQNDPDPANALRFFRSSHDPWIVAVNMISEGVDIPRLRVVVYLTNRVTLLSFRQIVGRVVRTDPVNVDDHGRVYLPADHRLLEMAEHITDAPDLLPPPIMIVTDGNDAYRLVIDADGNTTSVPFETLGTVGEQGAAFDTDGREANAVLIECARRFIEREALTGTDPESLALAAAGSPRLREALLELRDTQ
ncbi:DEAD/DEAH box helicase family protein [Pseudonocardia acaciae]|uniref:DEAD/DEAH box helicase family protein n=1 Tax=Pseudonocardia acaciae TaxID=551276 RepID=UPI0012EEA7F2|nr:DEAD/DEAH box helicase family protein [Pseudonocardia acaciae]